MQLGDLDLLDLLVLLNSLELNILNNWFNVSRFNKTDWTANRPDSIKDKTTSDVKGSSAAVPKGEKKLQSAVEDVRARVALPLSPPRNTNWMGHG